MSSFFLKKYCGGSWISYPFISVHDSGYNPGLGATYIVVGSINISIMVIEVNISHTVSFGLRYSSFIQAFGIFAASSVSLFPHP